MRAAILVALLCVACAAPAAAAQRTLHRPAVPAAIAPHEAELRVDLVELSCHSCAGFIAEGTARVPGVLKVSAIMLDHLLVVRYDPARLSESALLAAIDNVVDRLAN